MKKLLLITVFTASLMACIPPIKPIPPIGCSYSDAQLVYGQNGQCYWVYMNCGSY